MLLFRERQRHVDLQADRLDHPGFGAVVDFLHNADAFGGQVALFEKTQHVYTCAGSNGQKEHLEGAGAEAAGGWSVATVNGPK